MKVSRKEEVELKDRRVSGWNGYFRMSNIEKLTISGLYPGIEKTPEGIPWLKLGCCLSECEVGLLEFWTWVDFFF